MKGFAHSRSWSLQLVPHRSVACSLRPSKGIAGGQEVSQLSNQGRVCLGGAARTARPRGGMHPPNEMCMGESVP